MSAEFDIAMNMESFNDSFSKLPDDFELYSIDGGNHAQFGWYGLQHGDGTSTISTLEQQDIVISKILEFLG